MLGRAGFIVVGSLCAAFVATTAKADQVVVFDETWEHTPDLPDSHYRLPPLDITPADWVSPVDYSQGSAWVYLEVHTKPTDQETKFQVCFEATPTYACTYQSPTYTEVGVYEWETPFTDFWSPPGEFVDWTQGVNQIACILKDTMNGKPSADNVGEEVAALYTPTEVRLVVTLVDADSVYEPPTPTGSDDTGSDSSGTSDGDGDDTGAADTTGGSPPPPDTTGPDDAGDDAPASDDAPAPTPTTDTGSGSSATSEDAAAADGNDGGCGCTTTSAPGGGGLALLLFGLVAPRRRATASRAGRPRR